MKTFILGAGLGTRLRPLTATLPKPLVPVYHRPLVHYALDHCLNAGVREVAINTHYLPEKWQAHFPNSHYTTSGGTTAELSFFHEELLLETGGGLKNIESFICGETLIIYNGDILTDFPIDQLIQAHRASGKIATLGLRSQGAEQRVLVEGDRVLDLRGELTGQAGTHQFTGIYIIEPEFLSLIPPGKVVSVMPAFWELARRKELGACVIDDGYWYDLGNRAAYLDAHFSQPQLGKSLHEQAAIEDGAQVEHSIVSAGASVEKGASVENCILWEGSRVKAGSVLHNCILCAEAEVSGNHDGKDFPESFQP